VAPPARAPVVQAPVVQPTPKARVSDPKPWKLPGRDSRDYASGALDGRDRAFLGGQHGTYNGKTGNVVVPLGGRTSASVAQALVLDAPVVQDASKTRISDPGPSNFPKVSGENKPPSEAPEDRVYKGGQHGLYDGKARSVVVPLGGRDAIYENAINGGFQ
jgi:hypothetical protein